MMICALGQPRAPSCTTFLLNCTFLDSNRRHRSRRSPNVGQTKLARSSLAFRYADRVTSLSPETSLPNSTSASATQSGPGLSWADQTGIL